MKLYFSKNYLTIPRISAYVEQYKYIKDGDKVLEIGGGAGLFGDLVKKIAFYKSIDIDSDTKPDIIGDVSNWEDLEQYHGQFDVIFCCQVLEHMPIEKSKEAIDNLFRLGAKRLVISLPNNSKSMKFRLKVPFFDFKKVVTLPMTGFERNMTNNKYHYWEIYHKNFQQIISMFNSKEYTLIKEYRFFERTYQHFFILEQKD